MRKNTIEVNSEPIERDLLKVVFSSPLREASSGLDAAEINSIVCGKKRRWGIARETCLEVNFSENWVIYKPITVQSPREYAESIQERLARKEKAWVTIEFEEGPSADIWSGAIKTVEIARRRVECKDVLESITPTAVLTFSIQQIRGAEDLQKWKKMVEAFLNDFKAQNRGKILRLDVVFYDCSSGCEFYCRMFTKPESEKEPLRYLLNADGISRYLSLSGFEWTLEKEKYLNSA